MANIARKFIMPDGTEVLLQGDPGNPGKDGFSPTVTLEDIDGGTRITITDVSGDHVFVVMNAQEGAAYSEGENVDITEDNTINVLTTDEAEEGNTRPITSGGVYSILNGIETLLSEV